MIKRNKIHIGKLLRYTEGDESWLGIVREIDESGEPDNDCDGFWLYFLADGDRGFIYYKYDMDTVTEIESA